MSDVFDYLVAHLRGNMPISTSFMPQERAYECLKQLSGEDWGHDADAWKGRKRDIETRIKLASDPKKIRALEIELRRKMRNLRNSEQWSLGTT